MCAHHKKSEQLEDSKKHLCDYRRIERERDKGALGMIWSAAAHLKAATTGAFVVVALIADRSDPHGNFAVVLARAPAQFNTK